MCRRGRLQWLDACIWDMVVSFYCVYGAGWQSHAEVCPRHTLHTLTLTIPCLTYTIYSLTLSHPYTLTCRYLQLQDVPIDCCLFVAAKNNLGDPVLSVIEDICKASPQSQFLFLNCMLDNIATSAAKKAGRDAFRARIQPLYYFRYVVHRRVICVCVRVLFVSVSVSP